MNRFGRTAAVSAVLMFGLAMMGNALAEDAAAPATQPAAEQQKAEAPAAKQAAKHAKRAVKGNAQVKAVQEALIKNGAKLTADGVMGKHTRIALRQYQKKNGLKSTGKADKATLEKLGIAS